MMTRREAKERGIAFDRYGNQISGGNDGLADHQYGDPVLGQQQQQADNQQRNPPMHSQFQSPEFNQHLSSLLRFGNQHNYQHHTSGHSMSNLLDQAEQQQGQRVMNGQQQQQNDDELLLDYDEDDQVPPGDQNLGLQNNGNMGSGNLADMNRVGKLLGPPIYCSTPTGVKEPEFGGMEVEIPMRRDRTYWVPPCHQNPLLPQAPAPPVSAQQQQQRRQSIPIVQQPPTIVRPQANPTGRVESQQSQGRQNRVSFAPPGFAQAQQIQGAQVRNLPVSVNSAAPPGFANPQQIQAHQVQNPQQIRVPQVQNLPVSSAQFHGSGQWQPQQSYAHAQLVPVQYPNAYFAPAAAPVQPVQYPNTYFTPVPPAAAPIQQTQDWSFIASAHWEKCPDLKDSAEAHDFFKKFDFATRSWPPEMRIEGLRAKLYGKAERALNVALGSANGDYQRVKSGILRQLDLSDSKEIAAYDSLRRGVERRPGETVDELGDRILNLVKRANPGAPPELVDRLAITNLICNIGSEDLKLNLQLSRAQCASFDEFVSLASQAEAIKFSSNFANSKPAFVQQFARPPPPGRPCYNCGKSGHFARNCMQTQQSGSQYQNYANSNQPSQSFTNNRQFNGQQSGQQGQQQYQQQNFVQPNNNFVQPNNQNRNFGQRQVSFATGSNLVNPTPPPRSNLPANRLKQNLLTVNENVDGNENTDGVFLGAVQADVLSFFENANGNAENPKDKGSVDKMILVNVSSLGTQAQGVVDTGAQISLVSATFLYDLLHDRGKSLTDFGFVGKTWEIFDVNGGSVGCFGSVSLPINRHGFTVCIRLHVTAAPFGYDLLFGTNALDFLGFKLFDSIKNEMVAFENAEQKRATSALVILNTVVAPHSAKLLEVKIGYHDGNVLITSPIQNDGDVAKIEPALVSAENGKAVVSIVNRSSSSVVLCVGDEIGKVEAVNYFGQADNLLASPLIAEMRTIEIPLEIEDKRNEIVVECGKNVGELESDQRESLEALIGDYADIFALNDNELTQTDLVTHKIETLDPRPIRQKLRPVPYAYREKVASMVQDYLSRGIVRPSASPYASPIVLVPKKDNTLRFCVDYRGLNSITVKDAFPLPNIDNTLLMLGNKKFFSTLDFLSGYWQIRMDDASIEKTAFITEHGLHEFVVMPFGLTNAVATFQRFMSVLFEGLINSVVFIYIDDILVASDSLEEHLSHLNEVFERIRSAMLKLKISKCHFAATEIPFLGHILTREGIKMDPDKVKPVADLPLPKSRKELQSFLGFATYYRKFIYAFGEIASPLFHLLREGVEFKLGEKELDAIGTLKEKILTDVVLYFPDFAAATGDSARQFVIMTDASKIGIAAVLCQPDAEGKIRPIYFASRQCNKHEARYCPTELEALAVRFGAKKFAQFITMIPCRVLTDHKALVSMFRSKNETGNSRVDRWILELNARFLLKIEFNPGKSNMVADVLSRSPALLTAENLENVEEADEEHVFIGRVMYIQSREAEEIVGENKRNWVVATKGSEFKEICEFLERKSLPIEQKKRQKVLETCPNFSLIDGLLYWIDRKMNSWKLFVPTPFRQKMVEERHAGVCSGHQSGTKLFRQLAELFFWPNMRADCNNAALSCRICAHARSGRSNQPGLQAVITNEPLELVCMDILNLGCSNGKNRYALVIVDHFTKWVVAEPVGDKSSESVAQIFVEKFILLFGCPRRIHSDRGKEFLNNTLDNIAKILKMDKTATAGYEPNANGLVERVNQILLNMLKRSIGATADWDLRLPYCVFSLNITPSESTGFSPYNLLFGHPVRFPGDVDLGVNPLYCVDEESYIQFFRENLSQILESARENSAIARAKMVKYFNKTPKVTIDKFQIGEKVMVNFPGRNKGTIANRKLLWNNFGPYLITELSLSSASCVPVDDDKAEPIRVPLERLTRVPIGVPDIATLPRGKNPFKNKLASGIQIGMIGVNENGKEMNGEILGANGEIGNVECLIRDDPYFSGTGGVSWTSCCSSALPGHENCRALLAADIDPVLDRLGDLGSRRIENPLKGMLATFVLREGVAKSANAAQTLAQTVINSDTNFEMIVLSGATGDNIPAGTFPNEADIEKALGLWIKNCNVAHQALAKTGFEPVPFAQPLGLFVLPDAEQQGWAKALTPAPWLLEKVRARVVHQKELLVEDIRVMVGDENAEQLSRELPQTKWIGQVGTVAATIRALSAVVLSSKVRVVLVAVGRGSLVAGESVSTIVEQFGRLRTILEQYPVRVYWLPPTFVFTKKVEYAELVGHMFNFLAGSTLTLAITNAQGRSLLELYQWGKRHNKEYMTAEGMLLMKGIQSVRAWIFTQLEGTGNDDLGIERPAPPAPVHPVGEMQNLRIAVPNPQANRGRFVGPPRARAPNVRPVLANRRRSRSRSPLRRAQVEPRFVDRRPEGHIRDRLQFVDRRRSPERQSRSHRH